MVPVIVDNNIDLMFMFWGFNTQMYKIYLNPYLKIGLIMNMKIKTEKMLFYLILLE
jgi:hypothetical protein